MADLGPSRSEQIVYLTEWAGKNGAVLIINGQVGIGRDATGILAGDHYPDTGDVKWGGDAFAGEWWEPEDSYHKHDCLCVLGHGDGPLRQLYDWVRWLDEHGYVVKEEARTPSSDVDLWLHGVSRPYLAKAAEFGVAGDPENAEDNDD
jgi:hypothetical protein